jgi:hypothetical protein
MLVVADTSVLINLCRVGQGELVCRLFHEVLIPPEVAEEFARLASTVSRFVGLILPTGIRLQAPTGLLPAQRSPLRVLRVVVGRRPPTLGEPNDNQFEIETRHLPPQGS